jgi:O-antigen/teichoic acid export membrane protein
MLDRIFKLGKEAAIYGLSSIVGRFLNFLLVPFLTNYLLKAELGVYSYVYSYIAFAFVLYGYGMDSAYMRFAVSADAGDKKIKVSVPFVSLLITSLVLSSLITVYAAGISEVLGIGADRAHLVRYSAWILCFDTLAIVPFAYLRMENRAKLFAGLRVFNIVIYVALTIVGLVFLDLKLESLFIANLLASLITAIALIVVILPLLTFRFSGRLYREMLGFGLPYIPAGLAGIAIQVIDRPILKMLTDDATVGVYQAGYRLGVLMMLVVGMFDYAWRPFFLTHAKDEDAPKLFSKVFTYFVGFMMLVFVLGSLFVEDIARIPIAGRYFIGPDFWGGLGIVPIVLLAYVFTGAYVNFVVGVYLEKKTKYLPYATGAGAIVNVVANFILIPKLGITGAAIATLLSYVVMAIGIYFPSQRLYHVQYEWGRVARLFLVALGVVLLFLSLNLQPMTGTSLLIKLALSVLFIVLVFVLRAFDGADIRETKAALFKMFGRS